MLLSQHLFYCICIRLCKSEGYCQAHVEQAAQDGQNDGQSKDYGEVNILELYAGDGALGLEEACVGQRVEAEGSQNGGSVEYSSVGEGCGLLQNGSCKNETCGGGACDTCDEVGCDEGDHERAAFVGQDLSNGYLVARAVLNDCAEADDRSGVNKSGHAHGDGIGNSLAVVFPVAGEVLELENYDCENAAQESELNASLEDVEDEDGDEHGDDGEDPVGTLLCILVGIGGFFKCAGAVCGHVALACCCEALLIPLYVDHTDNDEYDGNEQAEETARADVGAEVACAENVVGDRYPGNCQTEVKAEGVTCDNGCTVDVCLAAELKCDGVADKEADEAGNAGHCEDSSEQADTEGNVLRADQVQDNASQAVGTAGDVKQLAEQSAEEEQNHPRLHEADEAAHIGIEQALGDVHLVDEHENDGADNAANQGRNVFVAEHADKQYCRYENQDVHKYSPNKRFF